MHRNTFINSPKVLQPTYQFKNRDDFLIAGQMTGVEGYVESAASGVIGWDECSKINYQEQEPIVFPQETAIGSMAHYITSTNAKTFQPMNANFGLFPDLGRRIKS